VVAVAAFVVVSLISAGSVVALAYGARRGY